MAVDILYRYSGITSREKGRDGGVSRRGTIGDREERKNRGGEKLKTVGTVCGTAEENEIIRGRQGGSETERRGVCQRI